MKKGSIDGKISIAHSKTSYLVKLDVYHFVENGVDVIACPALELSGYGETKKEAENCLAFAIKSFFKRTSERESLGKVLGSIGWKIETQNETIQFVPPSSKELLHKKELDTMHTVEFEKRIKSIQIPVFA